METESWRIHGAFGLIGEVLDELSHADRAWNACGWGESVRGRLTEQFKIRRDVFNRIFAQGWVEK